MTGSSTGATERIVTIVVGYTPAFGGPPADVIEAGLTATVAAVLSTRRSGNPDSFRDHPLWLGCTRAITEAAGADEAEVYGWTPPSLLNRLLRRRIGPSIGALAAYEEEIRRGTEPPAWALIRWRREGRLVAAALCEPWDDVGGPDLYHDSYTTCVFVTPGTPAVLVERLRARVHEAGGHVDDVRR